MTGLKLERVMARFTHYKDSVLEHDIDVMLEYEGGIPARCGHPKLPRAMTVVYVSVFMVTRARLNGGTPIPWRSPIHRLPSLPAPLWQIGNITTPPAPNSAVCPPVTPRDSMKHSEISTTASVPISLPKRSAGIRVLFRHPTIEDGIAGLRFVDACVKSNAEGSRWVSLYE